MNIIICDDLYVVHSALYSGELCFTPKGVSKHPVGVGWILRLLSQLCIEEDGRIQFNSTADITDTGL